MSRNRKPAKTERRMTTPPPPEPGTVLYAAWAQFSRLITAWYLQAKAEQAEQAAQAQRAEQVELVEHQKADDHLGPVRRKGGPAAEQ